MKNELDEDTKSRAANIQVSIVTDVDNYYLQKSNVYFVNLNQKLPHLKLNMAKNGSYQILRNILKLILKASP